MTYPSVRAGWSLTVLLTIAYILSYVDRSILGLLIEPIKADLKLTDAELSLVLGPAFGLVYAISGLPLGWAADRTRRTWLISAGVTLWSVATAASGLARDFWHLFAARMGVGVGEAVLSPCAMSLIADSFPPERRGKPVAVYNAALSLGSGIASLVGAAVLVWAKSDEGFLLPVVGAVSAWQFAFFAVGLPGFVLALAFLLVPEPARQVATESGKSRGGFGPTMAYVWSRRGAFLGTTAMVAVMTCIAYSHGFMPSVFVRSYGWEAKNYAVANAIITLALGPATVAAVGIMADRWRKAGQADAPLRLLIAAFAVMVPAATAQPLMPNAWLSLVFVALTTLSIAGVTAAGIIALLDIAPANARGQIVALYYMTISITGLGLGPTTVGFLSTNVTGEANLNLAMAAVPAIYGSLAALLIPIVGRAWRAQLGEIRSLLTPEAGA
jgi:MFS family permease